jgi:1-acyl-sn-glycerol-3-phosphate acyltransferase
LSVEGGDKEAEARFRDAAVSEICYALAGSRRGFLHGLLSPLVRVPVGRLARIAATADRAAARDGLPGAARAIRTALRLDPRARGAERIPEAGPLIIAANHPGGFDSAALLSLLTRSDVKVVLSDAPLFRAFHFARPWFIFAPLTAGGGAKALRACLDHLRDGGAVLIFANGDVEPDPEAGPDAGRSFSRWSRSLEIMLGRIPEARLLPAIISGVIGPKALRHPLTRLRRDETRRQKLAETLQIAGRLLRRRPAPSRLHISFGEPVRAAELTATETMTAVASLALALLEDHMAWLAGPNEIG